MTAVIGKRIIVESEKVGTPDREGEILEVVEGEMGIRYRVRWDDGRETSFRPAAGSVRILERAASAGSPPSTSKTAPRPRTKAGASAKGKKAKK